MLQNEPMTKREMFAMAAMQSLIVAYPDQHYTIIAIEAVKYADATIEEAERKRPMSRTKKNSVVLRRALKQACINIHLRGGGCPDPENCCDVDKASFRLHADTIAQHILDGLASCIFAVDGRRLTYARFTA